MSDRMESVRSLLESKATLALSLPGVVALEAGTRRQGGRRTKAPAVVVTVERKVDPAELSAGEDLRRVFGGAEHVDVVEASPLKMLFAQPERFGADAALLADIESRVGYPFLPDAIGVRLSREVASAVSARLNSARAADITYTPPPGIDLDRPITGRIKLRCHASPDAGWKELRNFLRRAGRQLVVGMYELTGPHVGDFLVDEVAHRVEEFLLTMDKKLSIGGSGLKRYDRTEEEHARMFRLAFGNGFEHAFASTDKSGGATFYSDYHIKLAVRDRRAFWLSSGSWQSSNQPNLDPLDGDAGNRLIPQCNREWHVIGEHEGLSELWAEFLKWDLETAQRASVPRLTAAAAMLAERLVLFADVRDTDFAYERFWPAQDFEFDAGQDGAVVPLLTPDNYIAAVTSVVESARNQLLVQNQSLSFHKDERTQDDRYTRLTRALAEKSRTLGDFRLIIRDPAEFGGDPDDVLDVYRSKRFDVDKIRFQPRCHNKGIIADGERTLIGSHNFTSAGTTVNRDASLLVKHAGVAGYYQAIFEHDWKVATERAEAAAVAPARRLRSRLAMAGEQPPPGMNAYRFWELLDDD